MVLKTEGYLKKKQGSIEDGQICRDLLWTWNPKEEGASMVNSFRQIFRRESFSGGASKRGTRTGLLRGTCSMSEASNRRRIDYHRHRADGIHALLCESLDGAVDLTLYRREEGGRKN
ncbi:hypothetical protein KP509_10G017300 [Ceratopteris richardii]|uniref:Uncharacterized protein n=2 Tax=Ceratopteris richardii TaxID=49495 RepID=A0A8T2U2F1_CERRI|nr:hypothetical protein KP509_10G017300 [Ceratopteris richardii]